MGDVPRRQRKCRPFCVRRSGLGLASGAILFFTGFGPVAVAIGGAAESDHPDGAMDQRLVQEMVKRDRARVGRERERRQTAEARSERERSRTAFRGLTAGAAREAAFDEFPREVGRRPFQAPGARNDETVRGYFNDDLSARVRRDGAKGDSLAESTLPLRAQDASGELAPVDLSIVQRNGGFEAANPLAEVHFPAKLADGLRLPDIGLGLRLVGAAEDAQAAEIGSGAFYANAATDTDLLAQTAPTGLEASLAIRSPESPEDYQLEFELPAGARVERVSGRVPGVEVLRGQERLANLGPPAAFDAQGEPVSTSYELVGRRLRLHVDHHGADLAYPLLIDPFLVEDQRYWNAIQPPNYVIKDKQGWNYGEYDPKNLIAGYVDPAGGAWGNGLYIVGSSNRSGAWGQWNFWSPGDAWIYRAEFYASHYVDPDATASIYETVQPPSLDRWEHQDNVYGSNGQLLGVIYDVPWSWPHSFNNFYATHCFGDSPCWMYNSNPFRPAATPGNLVNFAQVGNNDFGWSQTWLGGAYLEIGDDKAPTATSVQHTGLPSGWIENASPSVSVGLNDSGVGVRAANFGRIVNGNIVQGIGGDMLWPCTGPRPQHCNHNESASSSYNTTAFPEGDNLVGVRATDFIGNNALVATWHIKIDRSGPGVTLSGALYDRRDQSGANADHRNEGVYDATSPLHVSASDSRSGIGSIEVFVDGASERSRGGYVGPCTGDGCSQTLDWTLTADNYSDGLHTVVVRAKDKLADQAGSDPALHTRDETFQVITDRRGDVYHASEYTDALLSGGDVLADEWAQINTFNFRHSEDTHTTTRDSESCSDSSSEQCGDVRRLSDPPVEEPSGAPGYTVFEGATVDDSRLDLGDVLEPAHESLGAQQGSGPIGAALAPWQHPPPVHGATYELYTVSEPGESGSSTTAEHRLWIDSATRMPLHEQVVANGQVQSDTYYTYDSDRQTTTALPGDEFRVPAPSDSSETKTWSYRTGDTPGSGKQPDDENVADETVSATEFRQMFGLSTNPVLILGLLTDPQRNRDTETWGTPLTAAETQELAQRVEAAEAMGTIDGYGHGAASADYAGTYIDQPNGGLVYVGFTANVSAHLADLASIYPYPSRLRSFSASHTEQYLYDLADQIDADRDSLAAAGVTVLSVAPRISDNKVLVGVENATPLTAATLTGRYGDAVEQESASPIVPKVGRETAPIPPLFGGEEILADRFVNGQILETSCSTSFSATKRVSGHRRYYGLTAGHCRSGGRTWYHNNALVGSLETSRFSGNADIGYIRYRNPRMRSYDVWGNSANDLRYIDTYDLYPRSGQPDSVETHEGEPVCLSGYRWVRIRCGHVTDAATKVTIEGTHVHSFVRATLASPGACAGDSGGAMFYGHRAVGLLSAGNGKDCGTDTYSTQIQHGLNNYGAALWTRRGPRT